MCNRFEAMLRMIDNDLSLHYWDWTQDPTNISTPLGMVNLFTSEFMGSPVGDAGEPFTDFISDEYKDAVRASDGKIHEKMWRNLNSGSGHGKPPAETDYEIIRSADSEEDKRLQFQIFNSALRLSHNYTHGYIGGCIPDDRYSFHDPFVFLLHSNVDRLFALWQTRREISPGEFSWRLLPEEVYGDALGTRTLNGDIYPWSGTIDPLIRPWNDIDKWHINPPDYWPIKEGAKKYTDITIITPPSYDSNGTL